MRVLALGWVGMSTVACVHAVPPPLLSLIAVAPALPMTEAARQPPADPRRLVVDEAQRYLAGSPLTSKGIQFSADPVGFVRSAYWRAGVDLFDASIANQHDDGSAILHASLQQRRQLHRQTPRPGDLVLLGTDKARPEQVAIVEEVDTRGTVTVIGRFASGAARVHLNLRYPQTEMWQGVRVNDLLQGKTGPTPAAAHFLSFADPFAG